MIGAIDPGGGGSSFQEADRYYSGAAFKTFFVQERDTF
jgi:hypothetical protein